jgi:hypothetical protein
MLGRSMQKALQTFVIGVAYLLLCYTGANATLVTNILDPNVVHFCCGGFTPVGEIQHSEASSVVTNVKPEDAFATYVGQTFTAPPGLATKLSVAVSNTFGQGGDGLDVRVLFAEVTGTGRPTNIIYESPLFTRGATLGTFGVQVPVNGAYVTFDLPSVDFADGKQYAWILDAVTDADGIGGYSSILYRQVRCYDPFFFCAPSPGNMLFQMVNVGAQGTDFALPGIWNRFWNLDIDFLFALEFADGGLQNPARNIIATFGPSIPEPPTLPIFVIGILALTFCRLRSRVRPLKESTDANQSRGGV